MADEINTRIYRMNNEDAELDSNVMNVLICDTQPVAVEGMKWLIRNSGDLRFAGSVATLDRVYELLNPEDARIARNAKDMENNTAAELAAAEGARVATLTMALATEAPATVLCDCA